MEQKILKMVAWNYNGCDAFGLTRYESIDENERDNNSWWYLHGKLEDIVGFDKATCINCREIGVSFPTIHWSEIRGGEVTEIYEDQPEHNVMRFTGVIDVEVVGLDEPCVGYFWTTEERIVRYKDKLYPMWEQRGLVCLKSDDEAIKYASEQFSKKSIFL